ncbi:hypothetical protein BH10BAC4_BH10BAC4_12250 [soil metagenome]
MVLITEPQAELRPKPDSGGDAEVQFEAGFVRAVQNMAPDPAERDIDYSNDVLANAEAKRIEDIASHIEETIRQYGAISAEGILVMPFEAICEDIMSRHDISRRDVILGNFYGVGVSQLVSLPDGYIGLAG